MAYTTIKKPSDYFNTVLYTGTEPSNKAVTGVGFQPDWLWIKQRSGGEGNYLADVLRGSTYVLRSNEIDLENNRGSNGVQSFDSDGFTAGGGDDINSSGGTFASWNWKANGAGSSNTDGSTTSTVSANTTSGFSIVSYTGTGSNATVGHGLNSTPSVVMVKRRNGNSWWYTRHTGTNMTNGHIFLNTTSAASTQSTSINGLSSSTFSLGTETSVNESGGTYIAYCFAEKTGYSKFGSYTGNGNANGTFVYCGFKPAWVVFKRTNSTGNWQLLDNKRLGYNPENRTFYPNSYLGEQNEDDADLLSNGFKLKSTGGDSNISGGQYAYMAFAEEPLIGDNPATAR